MLRCDGMLLLGHVLRAVSPAHFGGDAVGALAALADACHEDARRSTSRISTASSSDSTLGGASTLRPNPRC